MEETVSIASKSSINSNVGRSSGQFDSLRAPNESTGMTPSIESTRMTPSIESDIEVEEKYDVSARDYFTEEYQHIDLVNRRVSFKETVTVVNFQTRVEQLKELVLTGNL